MNPDQIRQMLNDIVANPTDQAKITDLATKIGDAYTETHTSFTTFKGDAEKKDAQISDLQKTNMNLFLRVGQQTPENMQNKLKDPEPLSYDDLLKEWK